MCKNQYNDHWKQQQKLIRLDGEELGHISEFGYMEGLKTEESEDVQYTHKT